MSEVIEPKKEIIRQMSTKKIEKKQNDRAREKDKEDNE